MVETGTSLVSVLSHVSKANPDMSTTVSVARHSPSSSRRDRRHINNDGRSVTLGHSLRVRRPVRVSTSPQRIHALIRPYDVSVEVTTLVDVDMDKKEVQYDWIDVGSKL